MIVGARVHDAIDLLWVRRNGLESTEVPDGYVIFDASHGEVHFLNPTAAAVFELCDGQSSVDRIAEVLQSAFDLPHLPIADVEECLTALVSQRLIKPWNQSLSAD